MAVVIHTIKGNQYAYEHHREGSKVVCDYLGRAGGKGDTNEGTQIYHNQHQQPEVTQHIEKKISHHQGTPLNFMGDVGKTKLWTSDKIAHDDYEKIVDILKKQPEGLRPDVEEVEVFTNEQSYPFKVGDVEFKAGAHWSRKYEGSDERDKGRVRLFGSFGEGIIYHETGHALFDKLEEKSSAELKTYNVNIANRIREKVSQKANKEYGRIETKWTPIISKEAIKRDELLDKSYAMSGWNKEEQAAITKEYKKSERKLKTLFKKRDTELKEVHEKFDPESWVEKYRRAKAPTALLMEEFRHATHKEGGITSYSNAYVKANESSAGTENFAEHANLYLTEYSPESFEALSVRGAQIYRSERPESFRAFSKLVEPHIIGWSVPIKTRTKEENERNYTHYQKEATERRKEREWGTPLPQLTEQEQADYRKKYPQLE